MILSWPGSTEGDGCGAANSMSLACEGKGCTPLLERLLLDIGDNLPEPFVNLAKNAFIIIQLRA